MCTKRPSAAPAVGSGVVNLSPTKRRRRGADESEVNDSDQENACGGVNGALSWKSDEPEVEEQGLGKRIGKQKDFKQRRSKNLGEKMSEEEEVRRVLLSMTSCEGRRKKKFASYLISE